MKLPRVQQPDRYIGLYVYDFGTHACVGYTAGEIETLRRQAEFSSGQAYEICRIDENGSFFLRGAITQSWQAQQAMAFLRDDAHQAQADYQSIISLATDAPLICSGELVLTQVYDFQPTHVTALIYKQANTNIVTQWLSRFGFDGGDRVMCGEDVCRQVVSEKNIRLASQHLPISSTYHDRPLAELIDSVEEAVQR